MTTTESEVAAFLASDVVRGIDYVAPEDVRTALTRFLACAREELDKGFSELTGLELEELLRRRLPGRYVPDEPLARRTIDVLRLYLAFREPELEAEHGRDLRSALEAGAEPFRDAVRDGGRT